LTDILKRKRVVDSMVCRLLALQLDQISLPTDDVANSHLKKITCDFMFTQLQFAFSESWNSAQALAIMNVFAATFQYSFIQTQATLEDSFAYFSSYLKPHCIPNENPSLLSVLESQKVFIQASNS